MDDVKVQLRQFLDPQTAASVNDLLDRATLADGRHPLNDQQWLAFVAAAPAAAPLGGTGRAAVASAAPGGRGGAGEQGGREGQRGITAEVDGVTVGYGQLTRAQGPWELALVVDPTHRIDASVARSLARAALDHVASRRGGHVVLWVQQPSSKLDVELCAELSAVLSALGFSLERELLQLRVPLPLGPAGDPARAAAGSLNLRSFRPGFDEAAWIEVNNRAFAGHPEQGAWELGVLAERETQPWFDPEGFVVLEHDGLLAGSCWTKVHRECSPPIGEIYVISVDPRHHGHGLGRVLTVAGLDRLAARGVGVGMLYVDRANGAAMALYRSLGFMEHRLDRAYGIEVAGT